MQVYKYTCMYYINIYSIKTDTICHLSGTLVEASLSASQ